MTTVELQLPRQVSAEDVVARLARVPVPGEAVDFSEEYPDADLAGLAFEVVSVIWPVTPDPLASIDENPVLVLRLP